MLKRSTLLVLAVILVVLAVLSGTFGCAKTPTPTTTTPAQVIKLKYGTYLMTNITTQLDEYFVSELEKRSGGRLKVDRFPDGVLGDALEHFNLVKYGAIDIFKVDPGAAPMEVPLESALNDLFGCYGGSTMEAFEVTNYLAFKNPVMAPLFKQEAAKNGLISFYENPYFAYDIYTRVPVTKIADLKGLKLRTTGEWMPKIFEGLGAVGVGISFGEIYESIQKGIVDGLGMNIDLTGTYKFYEQASHRSFTIGSCSAGPLMMNVQSYNSLPADIRAIIDDIVKTIPAKSEEMAVKIVGDWEGKFASLGVVTHDVPANEQQQIFELCYANWSLLIAKYDTISPDVGNAARLLQQESQKKVAELK